MYTKDRYLSKLTTSQSIYLHTERLKLKAHSHPIPALESRSNRSKPKKAVSSHDPLNQNVHPPSRPKRAPIRTISLRLKLNSHSIFITQNALVIPHIFISSDTSPNHPCPIPPRSPAPITSNARSIRSTSSTPICPSIVLGSDGR